MARKRDFSLAKYRQPSSRLLSKNGLSLKSLRQATGSIGHYSTRISPLMDYWASFTRRKRPQKASNHPLQCAMKLLDGMGGNPHWLYQGASEPLGRSEAGRSVLVSSMPLKGTGAARGKPPKGRA